MNQQWSLSPYLWKLPSKKTPNEAPRSKLRGIEAEFAEANPPSHKASAGHLAIPPCSPAKPDRIFDKLQGILAKANES